MRPLTEEETKLFFEKLAHFIGRNIKHMLERTDGQWCFRLVKDRVYYVNEELVKKANCFDKKHLLSMGTCFGKFTHHGKFKLHITALDYLAQFAEHKVWVKPSSEMSFLYGNHVVKGGLGRITEDTPQYQGVVVYSMNDIPLGFGTTAKSTQDCRKVDPTAVVVFNLADIGEYLRDEDNMFTSQ